MFKNGATTVPGYVSITVSLIISYPSVLKLHSGNAGV
jgi:hypothetical protein